MNLTSLEIPPLWQKEIEQVIHSNRMLYEPMIDSANTYLEFRTKLRSQGYTSIADGEIVMMKFAGTLPKANTKGYKAKKSMIRKKK